MVPVMNVLPGITTRTVTVAGSLVAACAAIVAETTGSDTSVETGSFLLGGAGLIAALSAFAKDYWNDRQRQREHEQTMLRLRFSVGKAQGALGELYAWARAAHAAVAALPAVPELHLGEDSPSGGGPNVNVAPDPAPEPRPTETTP
jgi:hypothetical protein